MGAPVVLWDEDAAYNQLRAFLVACCPDVPAGNIYRARPSAVPGSGVAPSIVIDPLTPAPEYLSPFGSEDEAAQQQLWNVAITTAAAGAWAVGVLGESAPFVAGGGDTPADIAAGLRAAVDALALPVTTATPAPPPAAFTVQGDTAGQSLGVTVTAPAGGAYALTVVDDNIRRAVWNWGVWRVRLLFRDVPSAERYPARPGPRALGATLCERVRLMLQASSIPATNGLAYPYRRDQLQAAPARLSWYQSGTPVQADLQENNAWVRVTALDVDFQTPVALTHDVPSLDAVGLAVEPIVIVDG